MADINLIPKGYKRGKETVKTIFSKAEVVVVILLVLSLLLYGGLLLYQKNLRGNLNNVKEGITSLEQKRNPETEKSIVDLDKRLGTLKELFKNHFYWSGLFSKLEGLTLPEVYFSEAKLKFFEDKVDISFSGNALTYTTIAKQMKSFEEESLAKGIKISNISLSSEGGIDFDLNINFSRDSLSSTF